ncbi:proliferating cell nuclear antigen (pcna) [Candidatus Woesearchaeota archaeon CG1_02_57_44]|nr:MAG: proliferating cell nuclear antigen (pcna) [Candidatus Woesearchaeota archaeon CG1_02_57_44]
MKLTLAEPSLLKDSVSLISELVNEASIKVTKEGLEVIAMDPANVAMVVFKLLSPTFSEYNIKSDTTLGVNMANFKQILRRARPSDVLTLEMADKARLQIKLKGASTRTFSLPILEMGDAEQKVPDLKFPVVIKTMASVLSDAIDDADVVAEAVSFIAQEKKFTISAEGDLSDATVEIPASEQTKITMESDKPLKSKYSLEYLKKMAGGSKLADEVTISFNKDYPLRLDYLSLNKLQLSFILAPRVEHD